MTSLDLTGTLGAAVAVAVGVAVAAGFVAVAVGAAVTVWPGALIGVAVGAGVVAAGLAVAVGAAVVLVGVGVSSSPQAAMSTVSTAARATINRVVLLAITITYLPLAF